MIGANSCLSHDRTILDPTTIIFPELNVLHELNSVEADKLLARHNELLENKLRHSVCPRSYLLWFRRKSGQAQ